MRLRACQELGYAELPCKVLPPNTTVAKIKEYVIKDNVGFGSDDWDMLANEWGDEQLNAWGLELLIAIDESKSIEPKETDTKTGHHCGRTL